MTDLHTRRLLLHPVDAAEGERIRSRRAGHDDRWAADFPGHGDVIATTAYLQATAEREDQRPFGFYRITRSADGRAIGGIGFKGQPRQGRVEVGYGIAPSARGNGYAAEALTALLTVAVSQDLVHVEADTEPDNIASQRTLERAGFSHVSTEPGLFHYEATLRPD